MHIVDRRLNPGSKSLENRQRFLRRAKALVQGAVKKSSQDRDIKDVLEGGEGQHPARRHERAALSPRRRHARHGAARQQEVRGRRYPSAARQAKQRQGRTRPATATARMHSASCLSREEFVDLFLDDLELPDLAKRKLAERRRRRPAARRLYDVRLARQHLGQPHRTLGAWRDGLRCSDRDPRTDRSSWKLSCEHCSDERRARIAGRDRRR